MNPSVLPLTLADDQLALLADQVADRLAVKPLATRSESSALVDASTLAETLSVSRQFVYGHSAEL